METFFIENLWEIVFGLVSAGLLAFCKYLWSKNKKLEDLQKADQNRQTRQMILDEMEPLINEITIIHDEMKVLRQDTKNELLSIQSEESNMHKHMYDDLNTIQKGNDRNFGLILNSYKFRLIQLCKTHIKDGYITQEDFDQVCEMYKLYRELGGNGQAEDYYNKVLALEMR